MSYSTKISESHLHPLFEAAKRYPQQPAIVSEGRTLIYTELYSQAQTFARGLKLAGAPNQSLIALGHLPAAEMIVALWGCSLGGYVAFPLNTRFPHARLVEMITTLGPALTVSSVESTSAATFTPIEITSLGHGESIADGEAFDDQAAATLLMTSGSSGNTKFVQHSVSNHLANAGGSNQNIQLESSDRWLLALPLYHVGGMAILFRTALSGAAIVIPKTQDTLLADIENQQVTHTSLVATQLQRLLNIPDSHTTLKQLKAILLGGSAIPQSLLKDSLNQGWPVYVSYGSSEMASQIATSSSHDSEALLSNSGRVLSGSDIIISHEGEILVKGNSLAQGYREGSELIDFRDEDGWFHTGDIGYLNVHGALTVTGRMDNQFISGGENIQPEHIEKLLGNIPGVLNAIVLALEDNEFGARPVGLLQLDSPHLSSAEINRQLKSSLPGYMIPTAYFIIPDELISEQFKISRQLLSEVLNDKNKHLPSLT